MQIFQRYNHPLKAARIRQYLHEGVEGWHMPAIAEAVPVLIHVSLFLFLIGLGDFLLNANGKVGKATVSFVVVYCSFYIIATVLPVMKPQSPLRNSFYVLLCHLDQKFRLWRYKDRVDGNLKQVNTNMAEGQMELAMERNPRANVAMKEQFDGWPKGSQRTSKWNPLPWGSLVHSMWNGA
jgi:hypothetical protein